MNQIEREITLIKYALDFHNLRLLAPIRLIETGYEVMINMENRFIPKKELKQKFEKCSLSVIEIDTLRDKLGPYAYVIFSRNSKFLEPIGVKESFTNTCNNSGNELELCESLMDTIFFDLKIHGYQNYFKLNFSDDKLISITYRNYEPCFCPYCGVRLNLKKHNNFMNHKTFFPEVLDSYIESQEAAWKI